MTQEPEAAAGELSTTQLIERLSTQVSTLVRNELALATAEVKRKGARAGVGIGISSAGGLLALYGLATLIAAAVLGLAPCSTRGSRRSSSASSSWWRPAARESRGGRPAMKAWYGRAPARSDLAEVDDPRIQQPTDDLVRLTLSASGTEDVVSAIRELAGGIDADRVIHAVGATPVPPAGSRSPLSHWRDGWHREPC